MKKQYHQKAIRLSIFTVAYNVVEGIVAVSLGAASGSIALVGFGLDSFIESLSGSVMIWRFGKQRSDVEEEKSERTAYKLVGYTYFILGTFVLYEAVNTLIVNESVEQKPYGAIIAVVTLMVKPVLFRAKYRLGKKIGSASLVADSKQTLACIMLSCTLLLGAGLNYFFGLEWADPVAAIAIALLLLREGLEMREGHHHS